MPKVRALLLASVLVCIGFLPAFSAYRQVCHVHLEDCLNAYGGADMPVPIDAVAVHNTFANCTPSVDFTESVPASIMLLIDDSNSTMFSDAGAVRFEVIDSLIEIISRTQPATRLGAAVFTGTLAWNVEGANNNGILEPLGQDTRNAYLPIKPLTQQVSGRPYKDVLKEYLSRDPRPLPQGNQFGSWTNERVTGTDITLAFDAARDAFSKNQFSSGKDFEFIIFLSDGDAAVIDDARKPTENDYRDCDKMANVPATFTVYLSKNTGIPPDALREMNACIHNNNYSNSNYLSQIWFVVSNEKEKFLSVMRDEILTEISSVQVNAKVTYKSGTLAGVPLSLADENTLTAAKPIPLQAGLTTMDYRLTYGLQKNGVPIDTVIQGSFSITRHVQNSWTRLVPLKVGKQCYERSLSLNHGGATIAPGEVITKKMTPITINAQLTGYEGAASAAVSTDYFKDALNVNLNKQMTSPDNFSGTFEHVVNESNPSIGGMIEVNYEDHISVVWRNPDIPLDTIALTNTFSTIRYPAFEYGISVYPNPTRFDGTHGTMPGSPQPYHGMIIVVQPDSGLSKDSIRTEVTGARATIYDAVGNTIASLKAESDDISGATAMIKWDGKNRNGRVVGPGTYMAMIYVKLRNIDSGIITEERHRKQLGVKP